MSLQDPKTDRNSDTIPGWLALLLAIVGIGLLSFGIDCRGRRIEARLDRLEADSIAVAVDRAADRILVTIYPDSTVRAWTVPGDVVPLGRWTCNNETHVCVRASPDDESLQPAAFGWRPAVMPRGHLSPAPGP